MTYFSYNFHLHLEEIWNYYCSE